MYMEGLQPPIQSKEFSKAVFHEGENKPETSWRGQPVSLVDVVLETVDGLLSQLGVFVF